MKSKRLSIGLNFLSFKEKVSALFIAACVMQFLGCASTEPPKEHHSHFEFPESRVYVEEPTGKMEGRPYKILGWVKAKSSFPTLEQTVQNQGLCKNYYNKSAGSLLKEAEKVKADAVIKVRSVVFLIDGKTEEHTTAECSDDGAEGEILLRGIAIKYLPVPVPTASPAPAH